MTRRRRASGVVRPDSDLKKSRKTADGNGRTCTIAPALVDTNVLIYRHDPRYLRKQRVATEVLRSGLSGGRLRLPHQALIEFVAVVSRSIPGRAPLLSPEDARREAEELLAQFPVLYPNGTIVRTALRGQAAYGLSWFDAHLWAYADYYGLEEILSEDFEHGRLYGTVRITNPFLHGTPDA